MVETWRINLAQFEFAQAHCLRLLDLHEQATAVKFKRPDLYRRYVLVHGLLRLILANYLAIPAQAITIKRTEFGKPYLPDYPEFNFNISHSGLTLLIAVTRETAVGVDIEWIKPRSSLAGLVQRCCSEREARYWDSLPEVQQVKLFYQFWTRKEAFVKAVGRGIALGLSEVELNLERDGYFLALPAGCGLCEDWRVVDIITETDLQGALVIAGTESIVQSRNITDLQLF